MKSEAQNVYDKLLKEFQDQLAACIETGQEGKIILDCPERKIEIRIFEAGKESAAFHDLMTKAWKDAKIMVKGGV